MNDPLAHDLGTLLADAVADVEPHDRLAEIRAEVDRAATRRRTTWLAGGGAVLTVAATVAVIAVTSTPHPSNSPAPAPAVPSPPTGQDTAPVTTEQVGALFLGQTPQGIRLFTELHYAPVSTRDQALVEMSRPEDPDYSTFWTADDFGPVSTHGGVIEVPVSATVHDRPAGMTQEQAEMSVQQAIYTVQEDALDPQPVQFTLDGNPIDQVFGVPTSEPLAAGPVLDTYTSISLRAPMEGSDWPTGSITLDGVTTSHHRVPWQVVGDHGPVAHGTLGVFGHPDDPLWFFSNNIDVSSVKPGSYTLIVFNNDPSSGGVDSRTVDID